MEHGQLAKDEQPESLTPAGKGMWSKKAACCGGGALALLALGTVGPWLGALAGGALSLVAVLACPIGTFLMMRSMMKRQQAARGRVSQAPGGTVGGREVIEIEVEPTRVRGAIEVGTRKMIPMGTPVPVDPDRLEQPERVEVPRT